MGLQVVGLIKSTCLFMEPSSFRNVCQNFVKILSKCSNIVVMGIIRFWSVGAVLEVRCQAQSRGSVKLRSLTVAASLRRCLRGTQIKLRLHRSIHPLHIALAAVSGLISGQSEVSQATPIHSCLPGIAARPSKAAVSFHGQMDCCNPIAHTQLPTLQVAGHREGTVHMCQCWPHNECHLNFTCRL